jgi:hypothetical protein
MALQTRKQYASVASSFSLGILFKPEIGGNMFLQNMNFYWITWHHTPDNNILHSLAVRTLNLTLSNAHNSCNFATDPAMIISSMCITSFTCFATAVLYLSKTSAILKLGQMQN